MSGCLLLEERGLLGDKFSSESLEVRGVNVIRNYTCTFGHLYKSVQAKHNFITD